MWRDTGKAKCSRKREILTDRRGPCLVKALPLCLPPPTPLPGGLTPEQTKDLEEQESHLPGRGVGQRCAAENLGDTSQGSGAVNHDLGDLLVQGQVLGEKGPAGNQGAHFTDRIRSASQSSPRKVTFQGDRQAWEGGNVFRGTAIVRRSKWEPGAWI